MGNSPEHGFTRCAEQDRKSEHVDISGNFKTIREITNGPAWSAKYAILRSPVNNKPKGQKLLKNQGLAGDRAL